MIHKIFIKSQKLKKGEVIGLSHKNLKFKEKIEGCRKVSPKIKELEKVLKKINLFIKAINFQTTKFHNSKPLSKKITDLRNKIKSLEKKC
jgi:hypothetical protein